MSKKGGKKSEKRLSTCKVRKLKKKESTWTIRSSPGPHSRLNSIPLGFVLRDLLELADNLRETKFVLKNKEIKVDEVVRTDYRFPVGLFDVITIEKIKKKYFLVFDALGRFETKEINFKEKTVKLCKVIGKKSVKGGKIQIETNDGRVLDGGKRKLSTGDSIQLELPEQNIIKELKLVEKNTAIVTGGKRVSTIGKVTGIQPGTMKRPALISLKPEKEDEFQTVKGNIFIVGEKNVEVKGLAEKA